MARSIANSSRKRIAHTSTSYSTRLSSNDNDCLHWIGIHILHKSTRARPVESFPAQLVVLAGYDGPGSWCNCQCEMGWAFHHCMGWKFDGVAIVDLARGYSNCYSCKCSLSLSITRSLSFCSSAPLRKACFSPCILPHHHSCALLSGNVCNPFYLPCQSRRRRWIYEL